MTKKWPLLLLFKCTIVISLFLVGLYVLFTSFYIPRSPQFHYQLINSSPGSQIRHTPSVSWQSVPEDLFSIDRENISANFDKSPPLNVENHPPDLSFKAKPDNNSFVSVFFSAKDLERSRTEEYHGQKQSEAVALLNSGRHYLLRGFTGRLGNVLFQFASAVCIAMLNNLTLVVKNVSSLNVLRDQGTRFQEGFLQELDALPIQRHGAGSCCGYNSQLMTLEPKDFHHHLIGYFQSWKYLEPCKAEVKRAIRFSDAIVSKAARIVSDLRKKLSYRTLVGIHVRMGDYLSYKASHNGKTVAPPAYYLRAMTYFRSNFRNVTFVIVMSDPSWFRKEVTDAADMVLLGWSDSPATDMEVLSLMDHIIFSVGTFGWWAAYKSNGTVVCYKDFYVTNTKYGRQFWNDGADFIYPGWIPL